MSTESLPWKVVGIAASLLTAAAPAYVAYDVYQRGTSPEKRVELVKYAPINPMGDLSAIKGNATFSVTMEGQTVDNLTIVQSLFTNVGRSPILPSDFYERLSATVRPPWKIILVEDPTISTFDYGRTWGKFITVKWNRLNDTKYEADPFLFNPGDWFLATVYMTNTDKSIVPLPYVHWSARITNLESFHEPPTPTQRNNIIALPIYVMLVGWAVPFTIVSAMIFQTLYIRLLLRGGYLHAWSRRDMSMIVGSSLLSFAAADCIATYLFPNVFTQTGINHYINAPPILLHSAALCYLYYKARASSLQNI